MLEPTDMNYHEAMKGLNIPLGPNIAGFLGFDQNLDRDIRSVDPEDLEQFRQYFSMWQKDKCVDSRTDLVLLLEELVSMQFGDLALKLHTNNREQQADHDFRGLLALGNAAMLERELDAAEEWFTEAQTKDPSELAPYVNMAQILFHRQRDEEAREWVEAGLDQDRNHSRLWEMLALIFQAHAQDTAGDRLQAEAQKRDSWAGLSLSAMLIDPDDTLLRAQILKPVYDQGERSEAFLLEYTAVLGVAGQLEQIPLVVKQAEVLSGKALSWQLYMHAAQAQLGREDCDEALKFAKRAKSLLLEQGAQKYEDHVLSLIDEINLSAEKNKILDKN